ncbi:hypothetical protein VDS28_18980 [Xanthomonas campestris pv. campestris]|uniref:hypothetical protein n=1 Tax=unclassified Stenotrophomonas TaxID=196198 RepID=UPI0005AF0852|nr:hypothetical protein [Stenotrophomonas sp.]KIP86714.1 hypothetical protein SN15_05705 [Stenotrophomonas maltophilia]MEB2183834.1 hypothetical protein [Xanthomonas campestris pv. campestris]
MTQIFTFHITAALDITAFLPVRARTAKGAEREMKRINAKEAADALTITYDVNRIERDIGCSVDNGIAEEVLGAVFSQERAALLDFPSLEDEPRSVHPEGRIELTGDALATKRYPMAGETQAKALAVFLALDEAQLNAVPWYLGAADFYEAYFYEQELEVDEDKLEAIAQLIDGDL